MLMSVDKTVSTFIHCSCHGEAMGIDYDPEDNLYYFSYWAPGLSNRKLGWKEKLRYCWQVIRKGKAFEDELILTQSGVDTLVAFLNKNRKGFPIGDADFGCNME